jgi:hypothetical protein
MPRHAVYVQAPGGGQHAAEILQGSQVPDGHPQRHRGDHLPGPLHPPGLLIVVELLMGG